MDRNYEFINSTLWYLHYRLPSNYLKRPIMANSAFIIKNDTMCFETIFKDSKKFKIFIHYELKCNQYLHRRQNSGCVSRSFLELL